MATKPLQYDLKALVETDMYDLIEPALVSKVLSQPPFTTVSGIINIRDISALATPHLRPGLLYRSGALHNLLPSSQTTLRDNLGIKLILDLRSTREIARLPDPAIDGVTNLRFESSKVPTPIDLNEFVKGGGRSGYVKMYQEVLDIHGPSFKAALEWIKNKGTPILFHCTAGKDRTGVLAAIFLSLAGAPDEIIAYDYALSRIGVEPSRELLLQMLKMWNKEWTSETPGMKEFSQVKAEFMMETLKMVNEKYGGVEGYVRGLGFGDEDLERIRSNLKAQ